MAKQPGKKTRKQKVAEPKQYLTCRGERTPEELVKALNEMPDDTDNPEALRRIPVPGE